MATNNLTFEQQVVELTNEERAKNGLPPLKENAELNYAADEYAEQMSDSGILSHTGPDGSQPWDRAEAVGYEAQTMGENIAAGQKTPEQVVADWMKSPGHRANILNPKYTEIGVGYDDNFWVQNFGSGDLNPDSYIADSPSSDSSGSSEPTPQPGDDTLTGETDQPLEGSQDVDMLTGDQNKNMLPPEKDNSVLNGGDGNNSLLLRQIMTGQANSGSNQFSDYLQPKQMGVDTVNYPDTFDNTKLGGLDNSSVMPNLDASKLTTGNFMS
jgi:hypothetical protein